MGDSQSAELFGKMFKRLAKTADRETAHALYGESRWYDFHASEMDCDGALISLDLARKPLPDNLDYDAETEYLGYDYGEYPSGLDQAPQPKSSAPVDRTMEIVRMMEIVDEHIGRLSDIYYRSTTSGAKEYWNGGRRALEALKRDLQDPPPPPAPRHGTSPSEY